jgi:hypothetical protein
MMQRWIGVGLALLAVVCFGQPALAGKVGPEFRVNTTVSDDQFGASVAALANGGFVVVWTNSDFIPASSSTNLTTRAQLYTSTGERVGHEFRIGPVYHSPLQTFLRVQPLSIGGFVVLFRTPTSGIHGQRFSASGAPIGNEFPVESVGNSLAGLAGGGFVYTYQNCPTNACDIYAQRYNPTGGPIGGAILVTTDANLPSVSVAGVNNGGFVVAWHEFVDHGPRWEIYGRRYDADGNPSSNRFHVNTEIRSDQVNPSVAGLANGGFIVTWQSFNVDGTIQRIFGQRYSAAGARMGGEFLISNIRTFLNQSPSITGLKNGGFAVTWTATTLDGQDSEIHGRQFNSAGAPATNEFMVSTRTAGRQISSSVAGLKNGGFIATWFSFQGARGIYGQRFQ